MQVIGDSTTAEMLWEWALAEWNSSRVGGWYPDQPEIVARLSSGARYDHAQMFDQRIASTVARVRNSILKEVLPARVRWQRGLLRPDELGTLRTLNLLEFKRLVPDSPLLADMAAALERCSGAADDIPILRAYREVRDTFDIGVIRGMPILLARSLDGPFHILEGHRRLAICHARFGDGRLPPRDIEVILGIWPGLAKWSHFHDVGAPYQAAK